MSERRQEDYDRDFTALTSGLEMERFETSPEPEPQEPPDLRTGHAADNHLDAFNFSEALIEAEPDDPAPSEYTPPPLPPMRVPGGLGLAGWLCAAYVLGAVFLTIVGVRLPTWAGWLTVVAFAAAIVIGWRSLPRNRDPGSGDGAVV